MSTIKPEIVEAAKKLAGWTVEKTADTATLDLGKDAIHGTLPEELSVQHYEMSNAHNKTLSAAIPLSFGDKAIEVLKEDKNITTVTGSVQLGISTVDVVVKREASVAAGVPEKGKPAPTKDVKGHMTASIKTTSTSQMKAVRTHVAELGEKFL